MKKSKGARRRGVFSFGKFVFSSLGLLIHPKHSMGSLVRRFRHFFLTPAPHISTLHCESGISHSLIFGGVTGFLVITRSTAPQSPFPSRPFPRSERLPSPSDLLTSETRLHTSGPSFQHRPSVSNICLKFSNSRWW